MSDTHQEGDSLCLSLFGGPVLTRLEGEEVPLTPSHKRLVTLVWGHSDRGVHRATAIWLLWEADDERQARHRLRQLLHDLGARVGLRPVEAGDTDDMLIPVDALVQSDLETFRRALGDRRLDDALRLYEAGFAAGLAPRSLGKEYTDWLHAKREAYRRKLREAAAWQWDRFHSVGAWDLARDAAEVLAALEPDQESAVMKMVEARAMTGHPEAAHAAATAFLETRSRESPLSEATRALLDRINHMQPAEALLSSHAEPPPPLVGRRRGLATARRMLGRVGEGSFEFLLIHGDAGAGKTRVMEELWKEANLAGYRCLEARPVEMEQRIPLNPLVDMMADPSVEEHIRGLEEPWRSVIAALLPTLPEGMPPPVVPPIAESSLSRRLFDAFHILFSDLTAREPLLLFIDDLQWADATTVAVLQFVQRRWEHGPLGIVATLRSDLDSATKGVDKYLADSPELPVTAVELGDLTDQEARTLVALVSKDELAPALAGRLCALAGRNPFYLIELTRDYLAGKVQLPELPTDAVTLPISLRQLLEPRIQSLGEEGATVGAYLSAWGRPITLRQLSELTSTPIETGAARVEDLERCRLAVVEKGKVRLSHELFRSAIYQGLTETRRAMLHGRIAAYLEGVPGSQPGEMAIHYDRAGDAAGAARHGRTAADGALESGAMAEAAYFLQLVVDNESDVTRKAEATGDLARVLHMNREILRANPLLELAAARLRAVGNHARALRMDIRRVEGLAEVGAAPLSELLDRLSTIKHTARTDKDDEALALALDSELHLLHRSGEVTAIRSLFNEIRPVTTSDDPAAACLANASLALNVLFGDAEEALRCARRAVELGEGGEHHLLALSRLILTLVTRGQLALPEYSGLIDLATRLAKRKGDLALRFQVRSNWGVFLMDVGAHEEAEALFAEAGALLKGADAAVLRISHYCNHGELALRRREFPEARKWFLAARRLLATDMPAFYADLVHAGSGLAAMEIGALAEARQLNDSLSHIPGDFCFDPWLVLHFQSRMRERGGRAQHAIEFLTPYREPLRDRFPLSWIQLELRRAALARRLGAPVPQIEADLLEARQRASALGLPSLASLLDASTKALAKGASKRAGRPKPN